MKADSRQFTREREIHLDFKKDIPWNKGVDLSRYLLPLDEKIPFLNSLQEEEKHAASWALGLLAASAIKEHEKILNELRPIAYPENRLEGLKFFLEEAIHSAAYQRFLEFASMALNVTSEELSTFLPAFRKNSLLVLLYALDGRMGGNAIWWTVAATEEESIQLFKKMSPHQEMIDPVFFELNYLHFMEESRHSSFSYQMLNREGGILKTFLRRFSFGISRILQTVWLFQELSRFKKVRRFRNRHPVLENMARLSEKLERLSIREKMELVLKDISYIKIMTRPETHPRLRRALENRNVFILRLPEFP